MMNRFDDALDDVIVIHLNGQLAAAVEASWSDIDGADNGAGIVGEHQLCVQLDVLQLVDRHAKIGEGAQATDALHQLLFLQLMRRPRHHVELHPSRMRSDQMLNDDRILVALILKP